MLRITTGSWSYPAIDKLDRACRTHDKECGSRGDVGCCSRDDNKLIVAALKVANNPINILFKPSLVTKARAALQQFLKPFLAQDPFLSLY